MTPSDLDSPQKPQETPAPTQASGLALAKPSTGRRILLGLAVLGGLVAAVPLLGSLPSETGGDLAELSLHASPRQVGNLHFSDSTGSSTSLEDFRGKFVLLNVWATWCPPCREEMPTLDRLQADLGGPEFEVVALSIDRGGFPVVLDYLAGANIDHLKPYVDSAGDVSSTLAGSGVPLTLLIDQQGREIGRKLGPAVWDSAQMKQFIRSHVVSTQT
jgi:thiol-disulfide isomerase/thioredoxin